MMFVILDSEDNTIFTACDHCLLLLTSLLTDKSQSQSQRKVKKYFKSK